MTADQIRSLQPALAALLETFRPYLGRASNFGHLVAYVWGLTADLKRKSIEPIALAAGADVAGVSLLSGLGPRDGQRSSPSPGDGSARMRPGHRRARRLRACQTGKDDAGRGPAVPSLRS